MASPQAQLPMILRPAPVDNAVNTKASSKLKSVINILNSLKDTDGFQELVKLFKEVEILRTEMDSRDKRLEQLEKEEKGLKERHDMVLRGLEESHERLFTKTIEEKERLAKAILALKTNVKKHADERARLEDREMKKEAEITKFKEELRGSEETCKRYSQKADEFEKRLQQAKLETEQLREELQRERRDITELNKAKIALEKTHETLHQKHKSTKAELTNLRELAVELKTEDLATTTQRLESIWQSALSIVTTHLQARLTPACLTDTELWKKLKSPSGMTHTVPLPRSDTPAARDMRSAVTLAYLFYKIDLEVFQPNYAMHEDLDGRETLLLKAVDNSREESLYRSFLLSICPEDQNRIAQERANSVVADVTWLVQGLLPEDQMEDFRTDLHSLLDSARVAWQKIQRLSTRFEPNMEYTEDEDFEWQALQLESGANGDGSDRSVNQNVKDRAELVIFPRLYIVKDDIPRPVTSGVVLRHSQTMAAAQELRDENLPSPTFGRSFSTRSRPRRESISASETLSRQKRSVF